MSDDLRRQTATALKAALDAGAADAVSAASFRNTTELTYRDGKLEQSEGSVSRGLSLQLYAQGRYSTHHTSDLRPDRVRQLVSDAVALTRHLAVDPARQIPDPALYAGRSALDLDLADQHVVDLEPKTCLAWLADMDEAAHHDPRVISATCDITYSTGRSVRLSSNGFDGATESTLVSCSAEVTIDGGDGRRPEAHRVVRCRHLEDLPSPVEVAGEALARARRRIGSRMAPSVRTHMVVDPEAGGQLLTRFGEALAAGAIQQNCSFLADKLHAPIASSQLTITDDPLRPRGLGSRLYDGEGIAAKPMVVLQDGVLETYYVDTYYGRKLGWRPTTGSPSNTQFELGEHDLAELLAETGHGFYVTGWTGGNADAATGDFSFGIRGHRIEGGEAGSPVSEMNITGNYLQLLSALVAVGNDPNPYSSISTPTLVFQNVDFSGS